MKVMLVFGTRPEAIKMCPLVNKLKKDNRFDVKVCVTGQHREMLDSVLEIFKIKPDYDLDIMAHGQTVVDISIKVLKGVDEIIKKENPNILLVHGDTSTTLNAAMAAFYNQVLVGHVEAGLRSNDIYSPYPEEFNRKLVGSFAEIHFAPTLGNFNNLLNEGVEKEKIYITGNTVIDALLEVIEEKHVFEDRELNEIDYENKKVILLTCHRRENWGVPMENIFEAVKEITDKNEDVEIIFPMHKNPRIRELANRVFNGNNKIHLIEPLDYKPFANLIAKVHLIMTDSGGIQEEAPALGKPVLVLRTETERPEAVTAGTVKIIGIEKENIVNETLKLLNSEKEYEKMSNAVNPYGDGKTCDLILDILSKKLKK